MALSEHAPWPQNARRRHNQATQVSETQWLLAAIALAIKVDVFFTEIKVMIS